MGSYLHIILMLDGALKGYSNPLISSEGMSISFECRLR